MARLAYIKEIKDSSLLRLGISEGEENVNYTVTAAVYGAIGRPLVGAVLDSYAMSEIRYADECRRAEKKALSLLAFSDNSVRNLTRKLTERGFRREIAEETACEMVRLGYIREDNQIERLILNAANISLKGPQKIIPALVSRGYSAADVKRIMNGLIGSGEIDFKAIKSRLLEKHGVDTSDEERAKALLFKHGFRV